MDVMEDDKQELKRQLTAKRNKRDWQIFKHVKYIKSEKERFRKEQEEMRQSLVGDESNKDKEIWSAKTQEIRNKLTDKKRASAERWNRFAGTGDSGGRGL